ncbi:hypothetical protein BRC80_05615 [Halobacteriales archaeon QH_9_66_26]|nr:MAG: hypothetical protein BRC80_05615 [Halobacteriales archaeon QH_9_66_26]
MGDVEALDPNPNDDRSATIVDDRREQLGSVPARVDPRTLGGTSPPKNHRYTKVFQTGDYAVSGT